VWCLKGWFRKFQTMVAVEVELKSPFLPLFLKGDFLRGILTPLWKRGAGEIFGWKDAEPRVPLHFQHPARRESHAD